MDIKAVRNLNSIPADAQPYMGPPYLFGKTRSLLVMYETFGAEAIREILPEPLTPAQGKLVGLSIFDYPGAPDGRYKEALQFIPALFTGADGKAQEVNYIRQLILSGPSSAAPIAAGREVYGFAKWSGKVALKMQDGVIGGEVKYGEQTVALATARPKRDLVGNNPQAAAAIAASLGQATWVNLKVVRSCDGKGFDALQLVAVNMQDFKVRSAFKNDARLQLAPHVACPFADLPIRRVITSLSYELEQFTVPFGRTLHNYLPLPGAHA